VKFKRAQVVAKLSKKTSMSAGIEMPHLCQVLQKSEDGLSSPVKSSATISQAELTATITPRHEPYAVGVA
jgi:hypothetical protein